MDKIKNYYSILGLEKNASEDDIKKAYRKLAAKYHPDKFATKSEEEKKNAEEKFKEINEAHSVLSDPEKKRNFDQFGDPNGPTMNGFDPFSNMDPFMSGFGFGNNFNQQRRQPKKGEDVQVKIRITLEEAFNGCEKEISYQKKVACTHCNGTGNESGKLDTCPHCNGTGKIRQVSQQGYMTMINETVCHHCKGTGKISSGPKCKKCNGNGYELITETQKITLPKGIDNGIYMGAYGEGHESLEGGVSGNLLYVIIVDKHHLYEREGNNLYITIPVTLEEAWCGCEKVIDTLNNTSLKFNIKELTEDGKILQLTNKGMPLMENPNQFGNLYVEVKYIVPKKITQKQKELLKEFYKEN